MVNNENLRNIELSHEEATKNGKKGGIASGKSKRATRALAERIKSAKKIINRQNLKKCKSEIKRLWSDRSDPENKSLLISIISQAIVIRDCGSDVYNIMDISDTAADPKDRMKATDMSWDREEGKAVQSVVTTGSSLVRETRVVTQKEIDSEKADMKKEFEDE